jgi:hypothetical protein
MGSKESRKLEKPLGGIPHPLGGKNKETPHPVGACNFSIVARYLGNEIIGVGVRVRSILLRYTMIVMMRIQSSLMMIVTLEQRPVIVTLPQRIVMMTLS